MSKSGNPIYQLYLENSPKVTSFFNYPLRPEWEKIAGNIIHNFDNNEFLKILIEQNKDIDNKRYLKLLDDKNTIALVTGQQLGLFVSPLYTVYKILTTILYAQKLSVEIKNYNFVPVFWLEGEDHDFAEINHANYFNRDGNLAEVFHEEDKNEIGLSISKRKISEQISAILDNLQNELIETEFSSALLDNLKNSWKPEKPWNQAFTDQIRLTFKDTGLLIFNPADEQVKQLSRPFFRYLIENNRSIVNAFDEQSNSIDKSGFDNQVLVDKDKSYIFLSYQGGPRIALQRKGTETFVLKDSEKPLTKQDLLNMLDKNPEWFSSTVLTRPIWQSWMLPVVSYIAGPGEIAYWAQLKEGFESFNVQMPHVMPRLSFTMLEPKIQRLMKKYSIDINQVSIDSDNFVREQIQKSQNPALEDEFKQIKKQLSDRSKKIQTQIDLIDPTLKSVIKKTFSNADNTISKLQNRILKRIEEKESLAVQHFKEIHQNIYPDGSPQERVISSIYFLNKYGPDWLNNIIDKINIDNYRNQVITI
ncbi:MAG: bacillithiol biosynthesis cysteine-adding enzyme BshC [Calditrichaceae bacterium]